MGLLNTLQGVSFLSNTSTLMVEFVVENMRPDQDYDDFYLSGTFSFVRESSCQLKSVATGAGGEILLKRSQYCNDQPWVIKASQPGKYIFLKVTGSVLYEGRSDGRDLRNRTSSRPPWCQGSVQQSRLSAFQCCNLTQLLVSHKNVPFHLYLLFAFQSSILRCGIWDIITPHVRGIIGIFSPEGVLMLPSGL